MVETNNYQMAIDLLCCHLGITEDEAKQQLGLTTDQQMQQRVAETQSALFGMTAEM
ncbi:hypothetical protein RJD38_01145 [Vibrio scophthalmi]|uniref:Uncharacterized protein n=2 Tax=Vibrio scophthalmi TaxID=45658 RepID=A0A1B1NQF2_9VIBR|nr:MULTISPECIES: hypothetical protein [Vibrio]ANS85843.1 hypothetical protein VSVS12_02081 [Vibrio scophthalmi]ANU36019.1 hypothetical protein VSVS05_00888 [Vibrio scophthalmi]EGU30083.1 hypothetical protein VIS19158_15269 [Vibrio scophthalmi LMG 19158]EGU36575.1 hypothetical protein VIBRN418_07581 [Vibrio sp. N418]MCY9803191.1 hypothetical protein [Vibrio scophthalmi]